MRADSTFDAEDSLLLKKRRPWYYLALALLLLSALTRQPFLLLAATFTGLVGLTPELWFRFALKHLSIRQQVDHQHLFFGEQVTLSITVENRKLLPLPGLQIEDTISPPLTIAHVATSRLQTTLRDTLISTWLLWSYQRVTRRYRMRCHARGFHLFGPIQLRSSDPLGWLERELQVPAHETLLVYPLIAPLESLGLPAVFPMGDAIGAHNLLEDPLWFAGNREYQLGDDPRRIDWKATARAGTLRSKLYESTTERRLLVLLDTWTWTNEKNAMDEELQEFCISITASLATWGLDEGYMVGILANCATIAADHSLSAMISTDQEIAASATSKTISSTISPPGVSLPCARDDTQYEQILTLLATMIPTYNTPIEHIIEHENALFQPGTTIILVSPINTLSANTIEGLYTHRRRGNAINILLVGDLEPEKSLPDTEDIPTYQIGGKEKWRELIQTVGDETHGDIGTSAHSLQLD
jgi:uncharacterized protein (DUF58 family)